MRRLVLGLLIAVPLSAQPIRQSKSLLLYEPAKRDARQPPTARVRGLIHDLDSPDAERHAAAERALLAQCPGIEPQLRYALAQEEKAAPAPLPKSAPLTQEYVRGGAFSRFQPADLLPRGAAHSLAALLERCEELRHSKPALITLDATDMPLAAIFGELGRQTESRAEVVATSFDGAVDPSAMDWFKNAKATVQLDEVPYWEALRRVLRAMEPPGPNGVSLSVYLGTNQLRLMPQTSGPSDLFRDPAAITSGPMSLVFRYQLTGKPRLIVRAVIDPGLSGSSGDSALDLRSLTDDQGHSLLRAGESSSRSGGLEDKDFDRKEGYAWDPADGQISWRQGVAIEAPEPGHTVGAAHGSFRVGFGAHEGAGAGAIGIPLGAFHPEALGAKAAEEQVYVLQNCQVLEPLTADKPVYKRDAVGCTAHAIDKNGRRDRRDTVEGVALTLTNHRDHAVTYVAGLAYFVDPAPEYAKPDQIVEGVGIYHAHAEPGQTVQIQMATRYKAGTRPPVAPIPERLARVPGKVAPQTVVYDEWRLTVDSVVRNGETYVIAGRAMLPADGPFGDGESGAGYIYVSAADVQGWQIESYPHFNTLRREGDHLVEDFELVTREPGRIPAALVWQMPNATHWLTSTF